MVEIKLTNAKIFGLPTITEYKAELYKMFVSVQDTSNAPNFQIWECELFISNEELHKYLLETPVTITGFPRFNARISKSGNPKPLLYCLVDKIDI